MEKIKRGFLALVYFSLFIALAFCAQATEWNTVTTSPYTHNYGVGTVGAGNYLVLANSQNSGSSVMMKYNTNTNSWSTTTNPAGADNYFKNAAALVWDKEDYVYALFGASYNDFETPSLRRYYFKRFNTITNTWETLANTRWHQGAGDAMVLVELNGNKYIYATIGTSSSAASSNVNGVQFWRYNIQTNTWDQNLTRNPYGADDGSSLVWTGEDYIYGTPGAYSENMQKIEETHFFKYSISSNAWTELAHTPYDPILGGIDDGGSMIYPGRGKYIYMLKGGNDPPGGSVPAGDFWRYAITNNTWEILTSLPLGVGEQNGPRLGLIGNKIYAWRAYSGDGTIWNYNLDPSHLLLSGQTYYLNSSAASNINVEITNLNSGVRWNAVTNGNQYSLDLILGTQVNVSNTLRFIAKDSEESLKVYDYVVTQQDSINEAKINDLYLDIHYRDLKSFPYYTPTSDTGAAVSQMMLNYLFWNSSQYSTPPMTYPSQTDLFNSFNTQGGTYLNSMELMMGLRYEVKHQPSGLDYGYFYNLAHTTNISRALMLIAIWIDYPVDAYNFQRTTPVPLSGLPNHVPVAVPLYGNYSNWAVVRGIHTNMNAWWPYNLENLTVYGFWINGFSSEGLSENIYVTAQRFTDIYYKPLNMPGEDFNLEYISVTEPPEVFDMDSISGDIKMAKSAKEFSALDSKTINSALTQKTSSSTLISANQILADTAFKVANKVLSLDSKYGKDFSSAKAKGTPLISKQSSIAVFIGSQYRYEIMIDSSFGYLLEIRIKPVKQIITGPKPVPVQIE